MYILHLYKDYFPVLGGIENYVKLLAEGQAAQGHKVEVLVNNTNWRTLHQYQNGVKITKVGRWLHLASTPLSPRYPLELFRRLYQAQPPDIIHLHFPYPISEISWLLGSYLPRFGKKRPKCVITYHSDIVRQQRLLQFYTPVLKRVLRRADLILSTSPNYIQSSPFLREVAGKCQPVPLGTDCQRFLKPDPQKVAAIRQQNPGPILLSVGRLRYYKGLQYLLAAIPQVENSARLLIIGTGPMETELQQQVTQLDLNQRVTFLGEISDEELPNYYAACDLFVFPSSERSEAFGLVQVEAMASAKPVVSTELGTGTSYVNLNNETGLVVLPANSTALARAINQLLADETTRLQMGQQGRTRALAEFTAEKTLARVERAYQEVLGNEEQGARSKEQE